MKLTAVKVLLKVTEIVSQDNILYNKIKTDNNK